MALVGVATRATRLDADHAITGVAHGDHMLLVKWREKAWPSGATFKLCEAAEQRQTAQAADIDAVLLVIEQATAKRGLGAMVQEYIAFWAAQRRLQPRALR